MAGAGDGPSEAAGPDAPAMAAGEDGDLGVRGDAVVVEMGRIAMAEQSKLEEAAAAASSGVEVRKGEYVVVDVRGGEGGKSQGLGVDEEEEEVMCRICHLSSDPEWPDGAELMQIGCGCKDELGTVHRHCAEAWFKLKGNRYCEICGQCAKNITGIQDADFMEEWNERRMAAELRNNNSNQGFWRSQPCCNFLMACLVVSFILPWFFHVNLF